MSAARPGRGVDAAIREIERRQIAAWAESFARQDADYRGRWGHLDRPLEPQHFEVRFGPARKSNAASIATPPSTDKLFELEATVDGRKESVLFTGQVDRIDVGRVGETVVFNVIDYKSGARAAVREAEIHSGRQIQLPLYALAVEMLALAGDKAVPLTAGYWSIQGEGYRVAARSGGPLAINEVQKDKLVAAPTWATTRDRLVARIGEIIAAIRRGQFPVYNDDQQCTSRCELRTICRVAQVRSLEKSWPAEKSHAKAPRRKKDTEG